jgi:hypothetical protein
MKQETIGIHAPEVAGLELRRLSARCVRILDDDLPHDAGGDRLTGLVGDVDTTAGARISDGRMSSGTTLSCVSTLSVTLPTSVREYELTKRAPGAKCRLNAAKSSGSTRSPTNRMTFTVRSADRRERAPR